MKQPVRSVEATPAEAIPTEMPLAPSPPDPVAQAIAELPPPPPPLCEAADRPCLWNRDMSDAPRDGRVLILTERLENEDGVRARWYTALGQARPWKKAPSGWLNTDTKQWLGFEPAGWAHAARGW